EVAKTRLRASADRKAAANGQFRSRRRAHLRHGPPRGAMVRRGWVVPPCDQRSLNPPTRKETAGKETATCDRRYFARRAQTLRLACIAPMCDPNHLGLNGRPTENGMILAVPLSPGISDAGTAWPGVELHVLRRVQAAWSKADVQAPFTHQGLYRSAG
ncbi:MAG: hypothetical protein ACFCUN_04820, partial [Hyphomicrobiaceae bacterium]